MPNSHLKGYDVKQLFTIADRLRNMEAWLNLRLQEREPLVRQTVLSLMMQQHILITGDTGTGKSHMARLVFDAIEGEKVFEIGLNKFTTDSAVFGPVDAKVLREQGIMVHNTNGSIVEAHIAYLDEFLDASTPLLRSLLTVLNERKFVKGQQNKDAALMTAIATTNGDPYAEMLKNPDLKAVVDRFLFKARVASLKEKTNRKKMVQSFLQGKVPANPHVSLEELQVMGSVIKDRNLLLDDFLIDLYLTILEQWSEKTLLVTDRSTNLMTESLEAHALLNGRTVVSLEDLNVLKYVLGESGNPDHEKTWEIISKATIEKEQAKIASSADEMADKMLTKLSTEMPRLQLNPTPDDLKKAAIEIVRIRQEVDAIKPQSSTVRNKRTALLEELGKMEKKVTSSLFSAK